MNTITQRVKKNKMMQLPPMLRSSLKMQNLFVTPLLKTLGIMGTRVSLEKSRARIRMLKHPLHVRLQL